MAAKPQANSNKQSVLLATTRPCVMFELFVAKLAGTLQAEVTFAECRQGARFTKWRAALKVSDNLPSKDAIEQNAKDLASYAVISQVPQATHLITAAVCPTTDYSGKCVISEAVNHPAYAFCLCVKQSVLGDATVVAHSSHSLDKSLYLAFCHICISFATSSAAVPTGASCEARGADRRPSFSEEFGRGL